MIFVDTSGWFAGIVPSDQDHEAARNWFRQNREILFTTDYVIDETLTLFKARGENTRALQIAERFFNKELAEIHFLSEDEILQTLKIFRQFSDKDWSFTDCSSKFICEKFGIKYALSFDKHFRQFGTVIAVP